MHELKLNTLFAKNIEATYGQNGKVWLNNLSDLIEKLSAQWNF